MMIRRGLYLLTRETRDTAALVATVRAAIAGGAVLVQYRDKSNDAGSRSEQVRALVALGRSAGVPILVNDDVSLARECGAAGRGFVEQRTEREDVGPRIRFLPFELFGRHVLERAEDRSFLR